MRQEERMGLILEELAAGGSVGVAGWSMLVRTRMLPPGRTTRTISLMAFAVLST